MNLTKPLLWPALRRIRLRIDVPMPFPTIAIVYVQAALENTDTLFINLICYNFFIQVILTPIPLKDNSTYINASFIEGYENSETFIITQDPMENTISDFWRMVSEQSISTLVVISEVCRQC